MGTQAKGMPGKIVKCLLLCAVIFFLLKGFQISIDFLYDQVDQLRPWWEIHKMGWIKYPLFAAVIYLVFSEKI